MASEEALQYSSGPPSFDDGSLGFQDLSKPFAQTVTQSVIFNINNKRTSFGTIEATETKGVSCARDGDNKGAFSPLLQSSRMSYSEPDLVDVIQRLPNLDFATLAETANASNFVSSSSFADLGRMKPNNEFYSDFFVSPNAEIIKGGGNTEDLLDTVGDSLMCPSDDLAFAPPFRTASSGWKDGIGLMNQGSSLDDNDNMAIDLDIGNPFDDRHFAIDYMQLMNDDIGDRYAPAARSSRKGSTKKIGLTLPMSILESADKQRDYSNKKNGKNSPKKDTFPRGFASRKSPGNTLGSTRDKEDKKSKSRKLSKSQIDEGLIHSNDMTHHLFSHKEDDGNGVTSPLEAGWTNKGRISDTVYHGIRARRPVNPDSFQDGDVLICEEVGKGAPSGRGKYRCGRCGKPKNNHDCEYVEECAVSSQGQQWCVDIVDQITMQPFSGEYFLTVSKRKNIFEEFGKRNPGFVYVPSGHHKPAMPNEAPACPISSAKDTSSSSKTKAIDTSPSIAQSMQQQAEDASAAGAGFAVDESGNYFYVDGKGSAFPLTIHDGMYYHNDVPVAIAVAPGTEPTDSQV